MFCIGYSHCILTWNWSKRKRVALDCACSVTYFNLSCLSTGLMPEAFFLFTPCLFCHFLKHIINLSLCISFLSAFRVLSECFPECFSKCFVWLKWFAARINYITNHIHPRIALSVNLRDLPGAKTISQITFQRSQDVQDITMTGSTPTPISVKVKVRHSFWNSH